MATLQRTATLCATIFGAILACGGIAQATTDVQSGACNPTTLRYISEGADSSVTKSSSNESNIPQTAITFTQGGNQPSCVVVRFSAEVWTDISAFVILGGLIDDNIRSSPQVVVLASNTSDPSSHSFDFVFEDVPPGKHTLHMRWHADGNPVSMGRHITIMQYTK